MNKILYIIPGWGENCSAKPYQSLALAAKKVGYKVVCKKVNWKKPLSGQVFKVSPGAVVFGFSLGAILAWLVAQKYPVKKLILASMTPHSSFKKPKIKKALIDLTGKEFTDDIVANLKSKHRADKQVIMYGDREGEKADIIVKNTGHRVNKNYISEIVKLLIQ